MTLKRRQQLCCLEGQSRKLAIDIQIREPVNEASAILPCPPTPLPQNHELSLK